MCSPGLAKDVRDRTYSKSALQRYSMHCGDWYRSSCRGRQPGPGRMSPSISTVLKVVSEVVDVRVADGVQEVQHHAGGVGLSWSLVLKV